MELPDLNKRISELVDYFSGGIKSQFCKKLNGISQQRFNRIFIADPRTGKIPAVPDDILTKIINSYNTISAEWLLTGSGSMLKNISENSETINNTELPEVPQIDKSDPEVITSLLSIIKEQGQALKEIALNKEERNTEEQKLMLRELKALQTILASHEHHFKLIYQKIDDLISQNNSTSQQKKVS